MKLEMIYQSSIMLNYIERAGRTCYKSENKITEISDPSKFVTSIVKRGHESVIEHGNIILALKTDDRFIYEVVLLLSNNKYIDIIYKKEINTYILYGNIRAFKDYVRYINIVKEDILDIDYLYVYNGLLNTIFYKLDKSLFIDFINEGLLKENKFENQPTNKQLELEFLNTKIGNVNLYNLDLLSKMEENKYKEIKEKYKLTLPEILKMCTFTVMSRDTRSTTHQHVRHRRASYSQESQRYINYNKKEGNMHVPENMKDIYVQIEGKLPKMSIKEILELDMDIYKNLISQGVKPEDARGILPNNILSDIVMTRNIYEFNHIIEMRGNIHAQREIRITTCNMLKSLYMIANDDLKDYFDSRYVINEENQTIILL